MFSADTAKSTKNKGTWYHQFEPGKRYVIDSGLQNFHRYNFVQRDGNEWMHLGNSGSAAFPLIFK